MQIRSGLAIALAFLFTPLSSFAADKVAPELARALDAATPNAMVRILVRAKAKSIAPASIESAKGPAGVLSADAMVALRKQQAADSRKDLEVFLKNAQGASIQSNGGAQARNMKDLWIVNSYALEASPSLVNQLKSRTDVEMVYLDKKVKFLDRNKSKVKAATAKDAAWGVAQINAPQVWEKLKVDGTGAIVGHIDTGVDGNHPAFAGRILSFKDFTNTTSSTVPFDDEGHGSHTAGTILGGTNGIGVAPGAKLIAAKGLDAQGSGQLSGLLAAMQWMLNPDGAPRPCAVSNSWGADRGALGDQAGVFRDAVKAWVDAGIVPCFSSGNSGPDSEGIPGAYPESFAVGATDSANGVADFSSGSTSNWDGQNFIRPDVSAPGVDVFSAAPGGSYVKMSGTSMACPHVAGTVALLHAAKPSLTVDQIEKILADTSLDLGTPGKDTRFGSGLIDAFKAVQAAQGKTAKR